MNVRVDYYIIDGLLFYHVVVDSYIKKQMDWFSVNALYCSSRLQYSKYMYSYETGFPLV